MFGSKPYRKSRFLVSFVELQRYLKSLIDVNVADYLENIDLPRKNIA